MFYTHWLLVPKYKKILQNMLICYIGGIHILCVWEINYYYYYLVSSVLSTVVVLVYPTSIKRWQICKGREEAFLFNIPNFLGTEISPNISIVIASSQSMRDSIIILITLVLITTNKSQLLAVNISEPFDETMRPWPLDL